MAALSASRLVCSAMPVMVSTIPPMRLDLSPSSRMAALTSAEEDCTPRMASSTLATACSPTSAEARASAATWAVSAAVSADARLASATSSLMARIWSTARTCSSAPLATWLTDSAISPMARPTSSVVEAIWTLEVLRVADVPEMARTTEATRSRISTKALRSASRSERGLDLDGEVAGAHLTGGIGGLAQVVDDVAEGAAHLGDLVAALHVDVLVDVALGQRLGGR